jgi:Histidine kinase-, DNA gyrase B-, and HSP90-like ATPase
MSTTSPSTSRPAVARQAASTAADWAPLGDDIVLGKDVLELLSTSMYVDPMTIYREYVQNAADAIDDARRAGLLAAGEAGSVSIEPDVAARSVRIRDNGTGVPWDRFAKQLAALGGSQKRGTQARGFRGVGRLAGLGYCQELIFRSRAEGEDQVSELRWDCRRLQAALRAHDFDGGLADIIRHAVTLRRVKPDEQAPARFFEVELRGVVRHRNDRLLSGPVIAEYLAQVAPVPFDPEFTFGADITASLASRVNLGSVEVRVSGIERPVFRPHRDRFEISEGTHDAFTAVEFFEIQSADGGVAAIGWLLHHGYVGAIPQSAGIKGLRLRAGNVQVGESNLLEELFPETRFNAWAVGEVHILDPRIVPNGRRDHFLANVHYTNVTNHLAPVARDIARRCRTSSIRRKWLREFELEHGSALEKLEILGQGSLGPVERETVARAIRQSLTAMEKIAGMEGLHTSGSDILGPIVDALRRELEKAQGTRLTAEPLARLPPPKRRMYEQMFGLIYECSTNQVAAKALVDRILLKLG